MHGSGRVQEGTYQDSPRLNSPTMLTSTTIRCNTFVNLSFPAHSACLLAALVIHRLIALEDTTCQATMTNACHAIRRPGQGSPAPSRALAATITVSTHSFTMIFYWTSENVDTPNSRTTLRPTSHRAVFNPTPAHPLNQLDQLTRGSK